MVVFASDIATTRSTSNIDDDPEDDIAHNSYDLDDREDELRFAVPSDPEEVYGNYENQKYRYEGVIVDRTMAPVLYGQAGGHDL